MPTPRPRPRPTPTPTTAPTTAPGRLPRGVLYAWASLGVLILAVLFRHALTASMFRHMLLHIPAIVLAGALAWRALRARRRTGPAWLARALRQVGKYNEYGVPGLLWVSFVAAYWMIPKALDQAVASAAVEFLKFVVLFLTGTALADSLTRANAVIKLFFIGNFSWMTAIVGLLYQDDPVRLCNFYLLGDQEVTGKGLVALAVAVPLWWLLHEIRTVKAFLRR